MLKNLFNKSAPVVSHAGAMLEQKSASFSPFMSFVNYLAYNGWSNLSAFQSMQYYMQVSPLFDSINKIATECANIGLFVYDMKKEKFDKAHPVLDLFRHPNTDVGSHEFWHQLVAYYLITGNCYIVATGNPSRAPLELYAIPPQYITLVPDERDGYTKSINFSSNQRNIIFTREVVKGRFRYYSPDHLQEIYQIRNFHPLQGITNNYGLSPLTPLYYEIEQFIKAGLHNLSLLVRGGRPSGALTAPETLSDDAFARLQEQMDRFNAGAENAGRLMVLDNGMTFAEMGLSNKDMDFEKLKTGLSINIYNNFNIPLALISQEVMSYNNLETSRLSFYDFAVLPVQGRFCEELSNFLMYRYNEQDSKQISYNKDQIPALQLRRNQELMDTRNLGVNSINEIRALKGDEPAIGGDDIYTAAGGIPIARTGNNSLAVQQGEDNAEDTDINEPFPDKEKVLRLDYYQMMKRQKAANGQPAFTEKELQELVKRYAIDL